MVYAGQASWLTHGGDTSKVERMHIIDRRRDPGGKSLSNRQRFIRRARSLVRQAVKEASAGRSIKDAGKGGEVTIPADGVHEPSFRKSSEGGWRERVLPGNQEFVEGDRIPRPEGGGGRGSDASDSGDGEDEYSFALSREEFLELFLEDLELPDMAKKQVMGVEETVPQRAGFQSAGAPSQLSIERTMRNALSRRIALKRPRPEDLRQAREELDALEADEATSIEELEAARLKLEDMRRRMKLVPYLDPLDVRFRRFEQVPQPIARAVMFCLMDVSGSMDQHMKDLAKRFYSLLYLFLQSRYEKVDVVFIRHTHEAKEVDEETFFYSRETGGTIVSTALDEMHSILTERYPKDQWNVYAAQASDGDNLPSDNVRTLSMLENVILPLCQYYAYLEVGHSEESGGGRFRLSGDDPTGLWRAYNQLLTPGGNLALRKVNDRRDIFPVFRDLFKKRELADVES